MMTNHLGYSLCLIAVIVFNYIKPFLLCHCLSRNNLRQTLQPRCLEPCRQKSDRMELYRKSLILTRRCVCFECCDHSWFSNLIRATVIHIHRRQKEYIAFFGDTRGHSFHDFSIDRLFVVRNEILIQQLLDLIRREPRRWLAHCCPLYH